VNSCHVDRTGELQPTTGANNSLRPRLRAANVVGREGWNVLEGRYLLPVSDAKSRLSDNVTTVLSSVQHIEWLLFCVLS
jgi:hypothetical protein